MKRLVLLGGGHAQVRVLAELARQPLAGWQVHLVSPYRRQIYSGMLPGWMAGHYPIEACAIGLDRLAQRAGVQFHETSAQGLDFANNVIHGADGSALHFDALSIDTGPVAALQHMPGAAEHAVALRPIEQFIAAWPQVAARIQAAQQAFHLVFVGAGAAGVELAFAAQRRARAEGWRDLKITLVGAEDLPLGGAPPAARRQLLRLLGERGIGFKGGHRVAAVEAGRLLFESRPAANAATPAATPAEMQAKKQVGSRQAAPVQAPEALPFDVCVAATGTAAPLWPAASGLATDEGGFIRVNAGLQSLSHPHVFAAGDVAAYAEPRPKSGVFAVRAGPVLAQNLRAFCSGQALQDWRAQERALYLISTGEQHALATWGAWVWSGRWVWRWKDRIDRRFVQGYA
jgi:NADH dehydrogenase FAD-containing subunit